MSDFPFTVDIQDAAQFQQQVIEASKQQPVLVDFWADWCQPCKILIPLLTKLAEEYQGAFILAKVNADQHQDLVAAAGVRNLPTVKLIKNGEIVDEFMGAKPESEIRQFLDAHIENATGGAIDEALAMAEQGLYDEAINTLKALNQEDPSNTDIYLAIAEVYLKSNDLENCEEVLNALPANIQVTPKARQMQNQLSLIKATNDAPAVDEILAQLENDPDNHELRVQLANQYIISQQYEQALESFFYVLSRDINFQEGETRASVLKLFESLGAQDPLTRKYRSKLATLLY